MKKTVLILILLLISCCLIYLYINKDNIINNQPTTEKKLEKLGYEKEEINQIKKLDLKNIKYLETEVYEKYIIEIINNKEFNENNLKEYINFKKLYNISIDDIIYIVNKDYNNLKSYDEKTIKLMKEEYYLHDNINRYLDYNKFSTSNFTSEEVMYKYIITSVNSNLDYEFYTNSKDTDLDKGYLILVNKYYKVSSNYVNPSLVDITSKHGVQSKLEKKTYEQYVKMYDDAKKEGLNLYIKSAYRSYNVQNNLYNNYVKKDGKKNADTYSARPGYSEHQTGLAFDLTSNSTNFDTFENSREFKWVKENAYKYGFILRYPKGKERITGYIYEPWHYRYVGEEVAKIIYEKDISYEEYYAYHVR